MLKFRFQRLLLFAISSLVVLGAAGVADAACPPPKPPVCDPDFTGRASASAGKCVFPPPRQCELRGPRGPRGPQGEDGERGKRGFKGEKGATGETGSTGADGAAGAVGATGLQGVQGVAGAIGATGARGVAGAMGATGATGATGIQGVAGSTGADGIQGAAGIDGTDGAVGADGIQGLQGVAGSTGADGIQGVQGLAGAVGEIGADGIQGIQGEVGADGADGATGETGPAGPAGPAGPQGPSGETGEAGVDAVSEYAYVYNTGAQTVATGDRITFDQEGVMTAGFSYDPITGALTTSVAGDYAIEFSVSSVATSQVAIFLNGAVVEGSTYGSGAGTQQNSGQVIVTLAAGDVITLQDHTTSGAFALQTNAGGTEANTNASILIQALG